MEHLDFDIVGGVIAFALCIVYAIRQEGKLNLLTEILKRVEIRVNQLETRYNLDGQYTTIHRKPASPYPAE